MKDNLFVLIGLMAAASCTAGCWKMGEFLDNQTQNSETLEDESITPANDPDEVDTGIGEAEVLKENPGIRRFIWEYAPI